MTSFRPLQVFKSNCEIRKLKYLTTLIRFDEIDGWRFAICSKLVGK